MSICCLSVTSMLRLNIFSRLRASQACFNTNSLFSVRPLSSRYTLRTSSWQSTSPYATGQYFRFSTSPQSSLRYHPRPNPPPKSVFLGFLDKIPGNTVFYGIIGINSLVFMMWFMAREKYKQDRDPGAIFWMGKNFTTSWDNLASGRLWTPLTACFSHRDWAHILFNGFTFFFMAKPVLQLLGSRQFMFLYLGGLISSFSSIAYAKMTHKQDYSSHGASGAIYSIVSLLACVAPTMTFQLYGIIPVPAWLLVTGVFSYDLYSTISNKSGTTDTVGHVGGLMAGIGYFVIRRFRII
ncbi:hypothetical protein B0H34DRAFT_217393 [Crassisporium funariophilum]|nr:hypothetical protein B0H34DRAFT_217393 [Crassisporium funariophilum]